MTSLTNTKWRNKKRSTVSKQFLLFEHYLKWLVYSHPLLQCFGDNIKYLMAYSHQTFRKCGSHYSELGALEGVEVKVGEKFRPPKKITLPVGFHPNDPSDVLSLSYDFSLENEIIAKALQEKEKELQLEKEQERAAAALKEQEQINNATASSQNIPISIFSNVGTDILQPIAATAHKRNDSLGKTTFDLSDFEANGTNPFELVELQTINDLDVLKSVLEPVAHSSSMDTSGTTAVASGGVATNVTRTPAMSSMSSQSNKQFSYLSNQTPIASANQVNNFKFNSQLSKSVPDLCNDQLVDISGNESNSQLSPNVTSSTSRSVSPPSSTICPPAQPNSNISMGYGMPNQPFNYLQGLPAHCLPSARPRSNPVLVDVNSQTSTPSYETITPLSFTSSGNNTQVSNSVAGVSSKNRLPPLRKAPPVPPRPTSRINVNGITNITSSLRGITVTDGAPASSPLPTPVTRSPDTPRIPGNDMTHTSEVNTSTKQSILKRQPAQKQSKSSMDNIRRHSTPLPPITPPTPPSAFSTSPTSPPSRSQSMLPDPMPVLTESERGLVHYLAAMGFPISRVARAVQRLGETNDREVLDFLVAVEELSQKGFSGDNAEIAMTKNGDNATKALEFLELTKTFKKLGFQELHIHEALSAADNDRDKALDFLASISAS